MTRFEFYLGSPINESLYQLDSLLEHNWLIGSQVNEFKPKGLQSAHRTSSDVIHISKIPALLTASLNSTLSVLRIVLMSFLVAAWWWLGFYQRHVYLTFFTVQGILLE